MGWFFGIQQCYRIRDRGAKIAINLTDSCESYVAIHCDTTCFMHIEYINIQTNIQTKFQVQFL